MRTAGSNFGMEETGAIVDKKFEGYSNLKGKSERQEKKATRAQNAKIGEDLDIQYIDNLQKQIATMELQIKQLKDREIDQKNKASGYETLLRDGIPLNEHFLALKNKYNNEKNELDKQRKGQEDEIEREQHENDDKRNRIRFLKNEYETLNETLRKEKDTKESALKT